MAEAHATNEVLRKSLHIAFGFGAIALKWLTWWQAAIVCVVAILGNWLILHRLVGRRVSRHARGWDAGIVIYPMAVLVLVLVFGRERMNVAGAVWAILAFGDGLAGLVGKQFGGPRLPWNRDKSWSGFVAFLVAAFAFGFWIYDFLPGFHLNEVEVIAMAVLACAIAESLPLGVDDNIVVPLVGAAILGVFGLPGALDRPGWPSRSMIVTLLIINAVLAVVGYIAKSVDVSGMLAGFVLGAILIVCCAPLYFVLLAFFILGTATTKLGYARKARLGLAQEKGGRRGLSHAFANVGVAAFCALAMAWRSDQTFTAISLYLAAVAAFATATADTVASEVGQLYGRRTFLPLTFQPVPRGTEGAISVEGTLGGALAGLVVAWIGAIGLLAPLQSRYFLSGTIRPSVLKLTFVLALAAILGSYIESLVGNWNRKQERSIPNGVLNFFNTLVGALLALALVHGLPQLFSTLF